MTYEHCGLTSIGEILGDLIVLRNLDPLDMRLPRYADLKRVLGLEGAPLPRKSEPCYGRVLAELLRRARALDGTRTGIECIAFVGDTRLLDGTAFRNICSAGEWSGWAFIGRDDMASPPETTVDGRLHVSNRWSGLADFFEFLCRREGAIDERTAVVIDLDKTLMGARGRNDAVLDEARLDALRRTVVRALGDSFDEPRFRAAYGELNRPAYHDFTADNQDYLAYVCLMISSRQYDLEALKGEIRSGSMPGFGDFLERMHGRSSHLSPLALREIHESYHERFRSFDPTPFKEFRRNEYLCTVERIGDLSGAAADELLLRRIVITEEVRVLAKEARALGALVFGLSDKPDEAAVPSESMSARGMVPLHHMRTAAVRERTTGPDHPEHARSTLRL